MNNIEKLAIEHGADVGTWDKSGNGKLLISFTNEQLEAFAKALQSSEPVACKYGNEPKSCTSSPMDCQCALDATLQSSEPVARYVEDVLGYTLIKFQDVNLRNGDLLYTHPPASVPLEKYNKLLDALKLAKVTFIANKMDVRNVMEVINEAIAEAEGKEG